MQAIIAAISLVFLGLMFALVQRIDAQIDAVEVGADASITSAAAAEAAAAKATKPARGIRVSADAVYALTSCDGGFLTTCGSAQTHSILTPDVPEENPAGVEDVSWPAPERREPVTSTTYTGLPTELPGISPGVSPEHRPAAAARALWP